MSFSLLHPGKVAAALYWSNRQALRIFLGVQRPVISAVLEEGVEAAFQRYERICRFYLGHLEKWCNLPSQTACEIGCGDCLASADMLLGCGAAHVDLIESIPITVNDAQREVLGKFVAAGGFPNRNEVLGADGKIDLKKISIIPQFLEHVEGADKYSVMLSFDVLEHVADIDGFFRNCHRLLHPGGVMIHKIDLSGHGLFEDPMPPLDFQTYPEWLYRLMNSKYGRPARRLQREFLQSIRDHGFSIEETGILRGADAKYIEEIRPRLRPEIRDATAQELTALDWYVVARKVG